MSRGGKGSLRTDSILALPLLAFFFKPGPNAIFLDQLIEGLWRPLQEDEVLDRLKTVRASQPKYTVHLFCFLECAPTK